MVDQLLNFGHRVLGHDGVEQILEAAPRASAAYPNLRENVSTALLAAGAALNHAACQIQTIIEATGGDLDKPPEWAVKLILALGFEPAAPVASGPIATDEELRVRAKMNNLVIAKS
jgi:hypothetical protein